MYTCGDLIYGWPITEKLLQFCADNIVELCGLNENNVNDQKYLRNVKKHIRNIEIEEIIPNIETRYDGGSDWRPGFLGEHITDVDTINPFKLTELSSLMTPKNTVIFKAIYLANLNSKLVEFLGEPDYYVIWYTS